jgi:RNA polymerase sigma-54 factor
MQLFKDCDSPETLAYLAQKKEQLEWVQQCILQRNQTLLSLGNLIFETQLSFFRNGPGHLKPFTQAAAAAQLGVHESTISRAIRDKYLQCTWGTFPLQYFFPQGMEHRDSICSRIRQLILEEDKFHPLSDQAISDILTWEDLAISKRMVSKYRAELKIPEASVRRKY